jgi:proteasome assembly chaperone (PAC2) family protein
MAMEFLSIHSEPELRSPTLVAAFEGWPDAGEVASGALRYLVRNLGAIRFAELTPEEFYVFTEIRPHSIQLRPGQRTLRWPVNDFYYWINPSGEHDLLLFLGREPNLRWATYTKALLDLAERCGVTMLTTLGGTYDAVSHHGEVQVSGIGSTPRLRHTLEGLGVAFSQYQGPSSVQTALIDAARRRGVPAASLWGHAPHYIQAVPNVKVCHGVLAKLNELVGLGLDLAELQGASQALEARVDEALAGNQELQSYVRRLDSGMVDEEPPEDFANLIEDDPPGEIPSSDVVLRELEEFLRRNQQEQPRNDDAEEEGNDRL